MLSHPLILASTSPYRRELMARLGVEFDTMSSDVVEDMRDESPRERAARLARAKASAVFAQRPDAVVVGSDQVATVDDVILHKPGTAERAVAQLTQLSGRKHHLITAVCVIGPSGAAEAIDVHEMLMRQLSDAEIRDYVAFDDPVDCAGSYKIEGRGITLFERLRGDDYTGIIGLPLTVLHRLLRESGHWRQP